jgi:hypothetical protein
MGCGDGAKRVAAAFAAAGGPEAAADAIDRRLSVTRRTESGGEIGMSTSVASRDAEVQV